MERIDICGVEPSTGKPTTTNTYLPRATACMWQGFNIQEKTTTADKLFGRFFFGSWKQKVIYPDLYAEQVTQSSRRLLPWCAPV